MATVIAWIGAQAVDAHPAFGALYVWALFCDLLTLSALVRLAQPRLQRAANDER